MVALRFYSPSLLFAPTLVALASTMLRNNINCNGTEASSLYETPLSKCFVPCPPTQNDDFKLQNENMVGNGSSYCSYLDDDRHGVCQYSIKTARLEFQQGDPDIQCAVCLDVVPRCSDCDEPPCIGCEECFETLHTCQGDDDDDS